jgi:hypothetical protein
MISFTKINDLFESESQPLRSRCGSNGPPANNANLPIALAPDCNTAYFSRAVEIALLPVCCSRPAIAVDAPAIARVSIMAS